jgi:hypothetical protein
MAEPVDGDKDKKLIGLKQAVPEIKKGEFVQGLFEEFWDGVVSGLIKQEVFENIKQEIVFATHPDRLSASLQDLQLAGKGYQLTTRKHSTIRDFHYLDWREQTGSVHPELLRIRKSPERKGFEFEIYLRATEELPEMGGIAERIVLYDETGAAKNEVRNILLPIGGLYFGKKYEDMAFIKVNLMRDYLGEVNSFSVGLLRDQEFVYPADLQKYVFYSSEIGDNNELVVHDHADKRDLPFDDQVMQTVDRLFENIAPMLWSGEIDHKKMNT